MSSIVINGDTSGSVTLSAPAVAGSTTLTLPTTSGTVLTNASTQSQLPSNIAGNGPAFSASLSTTQSITSGVNTKVQFNTEQFDTANCFDNTTNYRFTPNVAGYYQINTCVRLRGTSSDNKLMYLRKNGSDYIALDFYVISIEYFQIAASHVVYMNGSTDYLEVFVYTNGTNTSVISTSGLNTFFSGALIRGA